MRKKARDKDKITLLAMAGSTRTDSFNKKLAKIAMAGAAETGANVVHLDLRDFPLPLFDGDLEDESGIPDNGVKLKELMKAADGFIIASPEYNSSVSGVLKNAIDWVSRSYGDESVLECFHGKTAVIMSASPGKLGGLRGLFALRSILENIGVFVMPKQIAVPGADHAFDQDGSLIDRALQERVKALGIAVAEMTGKLAD